MVKNTVIVPGGREGRLLLQAAARPERPRRVAGRGRGLLQDVHLRPARHHRQPGRRQDGAARATWSATTATTPTSWSPPTRARRRSPTSPTACSQDYGFWLGDAFASGGSVGYDHKAMGITARGAWVSVQRHFRERGIDCQTEEFTAVGIGDMSGDVFGNGLLCSETTRLVAAFDHRDIFLDPTPDAGDVVRRAPAALRPAPLELAGLRQEPDLRGRRRLPALAQVGPAQRRGPHGARHRRVGRQAMTPAELMKAILQAPVDLLWNGGIGTYVKGEDETHADVGDKANDAIRVNGSAAARPLRRGGRQPRADPGRPDRVRPVRRRRRRVPARRAAGSTPTSSTTPRASTPPTTRSTSRSCSTGSSRTATSPPSSATRCSPR